MDFTSNRGVQSPMSRGASTSGRETPNNKTGDDKKGRGMRETPKWLKITSVLLLFAGTLIVVGIIALLLVNPGNESRLVEKDKYQAVFLDNSSTPYFGHINRMTDQYIELTSIYYYINVNGSVQPADSDAEKNVDIRLQKLGCELHGPGDKMVINRDNVLFWENLRTDGQVTKAINEWADNNPEGLICNNGNASNEESNGNSNGSSDSADTNTNGDNGTANGDTNGTTNTNDDQTTSDQ